MCTFQFVKMFKLFLNLLLLRNEIVYTKYEGVEFQNTNGMKLEHTIDLELESKGLKVRICERASEKASFECKAVM